MYRTCTNWTNPFDDKEAIDWILNKNLGYFSKQQIKGHFQPTTHQNGFLYQEAVKANLSMIGKIFGVSTTSFIVQTVSEMYSTPRITTLRHEKGYESSILGSIDNHEYIVVTPGEMTYLYYKIMDIYCYDYRDDDYYYDEKEYTDIFCRSFNSFGEMWKYIQDQNTTIYRRIVGKDKLCDYQIYSDYSESNEDLDEGENRVVQWDQVVQEADHNSKTMASRKREQRWAHTRCKKVRKNKIEDVRKRQMRRNKKMSKNRS